jgi:hypothetical protein
MEIVVSREEDIRDKIKAFVGKFDNMESRVKEVEIVTSTVPRLEAKIHRVETRIGSVEQSIKSGILTADRARTASAVSSPAKAFVGGASISLLVIMLGTIIFLSLF